MRRIQPIMGLSASIGQRDDVFVMRMVALALGRTVEPSVQVHRLFNRVDEIDSTLMFDPWPSPVD